MKLNKLLITVASVALLTGCAQAPNGNDDSNSNSNDVTDSVPGGEGGQGSDGTIAPPTAEAYKITLVNSVEGVTLTSSKDKAKVGEDIDITVNISDDAYAVSKVTCNKTSMTKVDDTHYKFTMPDQPVKISYEVVVVKGDVIIQGQISKPFTKEGNIYTARNVKVKDESAFDIIVRGEGIKEKKLSVTSVDRYKTFANIGLGRNGYDFVIGGRATYDFFYDPSNGDAPLYVRRTSIDELPSTANGLHELFDGSVRSASSVMPADLASMTYYNASAKQKISWKRYSDNSSLANVAVKDVEGNFNNTYIVYNKLADDKLVVVDNFTPGSTVGYNNSELNDDNKEYSGIYKVGLTNDSGNETDNNEFEYKDSYVHPATAQAVVNNAPIDMQIWEADIMHAYRVGFVVEGSTTQADVGVFSWPEEGNTGNFLVSVESSKTINTDNDSHNAGTPEHSHFEYRIDFKFNKAGALLSSTFEEKLFGADKYNFSTNQFKKGTANENWRYGTLTNKNTIEFTYGEPVENDVNLNVDEYFVSSLTDFSITNPACDLQDANKLLLGDNAVNHVKFKYAPATALNAYQYRLTASDNQTIIKVKDSNNFIASYPGKANVTCGIPNGLGYSQSVEVSVSEQTTPVRSYYLETRRIYQPCNASSADVYTSQINEFGLAASKDVRIFPMDTKAVIDGESHGFTVRVDWAKQTLILDGSNAEYLEAGLKIKVKVSTANIEKDFTNSAESTFIFTILKGIPSDALVGTWTSKESIYQGHYIKFTLDPSGDEKLPYMGKIGAGTQGVFEFKYSFDNSKNEIKASIVPTHLTDGEFDTSDLSFEYQPTTGRLGVFFLSRYTTKDNEVKAAEIYGYQSSSDSIELDLFDKVN